jgi:hypothetical protein
MVAVGASSANAQDMENDFRNPPMQYRPYVWWHWMGSNFSLTGITKDLEAMKEAGIGGATIFNISSAVQESQAPTLNNPWPDQTYRSAAYWRAVEFACSEAQRLGLEMGLHNSVGYSTTGGPWIDEDKGMKHIVSREMKVAGGKTLTIDIAQPDLPPYKGWGAAGKTVPDKYEDIAVLAVPTGNGAVADKVIDISGKYDKNGKITWKAPKGNWTIFRIGYASTMSRPHPVPDDVIGKTMEGDKIDSDYVKFHWNNVLTPLKEHIGRYFGSTFRHVLIDSYEAGNQNWSRHFKTDFIAMKGYDPTPWLPFVTADKSDTFMIDKAKTDRFVYDFKDVIARLYQQNGWDVAHRMLSAMGLKLHHEPYTGPFSTVAGAASADLPMGEFWTNGNGMISSAVPAGGRAAGHAVIGAEAFTSSPNNSRYTEDPAMLKKTTEGAFASGVNRLVLHQWVHQPFDDRYQPGLSMGWWGTHFSRFQPWFQPGKAYFHYVGRTQYMLQQGEQVIDFLALDNVSDRITDAIATPDFLSTDIHVVDGDIVLPSGRRYRVMEFGNGDKMLPAVLDRLASLVASGATVVVVKPTSSPSLSGYPQCDIYVRNKADSLWNIYQNRNIFASRIDAEKALGMSPDYTLLNGEAQIVHRHAPSAEIFYIGNLTDRQQMVTASLRIDNMLPELWNAENGNISILDDWHQDGKRTVVSLTLEPMQSRFIVFRRRPSQSEILKGCAQKRKLSLVSSFDVNSKWIVAFSPKLDTPFKMPMDTLTDFSKSSDKRVKYFTGTATYTTTLKLKKPFLPQDGKVVIDLGEMNDIAILKVNGACVDTLWYPPYRRDITEYVRKGSNSIEVEVTNNWANRLIGDEQVDADFEWGKDRGVNMGRAMKSYPAWFINNTPRPQPERKCFEVWYYYRKDSPLQKAGLDGPVKIELWK